MDEQQIDRIVKVLYEARSQMPKPYSPERWAEAKALYPASIRILRDEALEMIEDGEFA